MVVDVVTEIVIDRPVDQVAGYADPSNAPEWYANIETVEWKTPPPATIGSAVAFVARFLGRRLVYTYELVGLKPGEQPKGPRHPQAPARSSLTHAQPASAAPLFDRRLDWYVDAGPGEKAARLLRRDRKGDR